MGNELYSLIIPTCNRPDLLSKCLNALYLSSGIDSFNHEIIITDDGTLSVDKQNFEKHFSLKYLKGPGKGPASNRNYGVKQSKGDWLIFTDDDCIPLENWFSSLIEAQRLNTDILVFEGKTICQEGFNHPLDYAPINLTGGLLWSCNFMIKRTLFEELGGFDEKFPYPHMEDVDLKERIVSSNRKILFVKNAVINHPPKRLKSGKILGKYQESLIYFHAKRNQNVKLSGLLYNIIRVHLRLLKNGGISFSIFGALWLLTEEIIEVIANFNSWKRKYKIH